MKFAPLNALWYGMIAITIGAALYLAGDHPQPPQPEEPDSSAPGSVEEPFVSGLRRWIRNWNADAGLDEPPASVLHLPRCRARMYPGGIDFTETLCVIAGPCYQQPDCHATFDRKTDSCFIHDEGCRPGCSPWLYISTNHGAETGSGHEDCQNKLTFKRRVTCEIERLERKGICRRPLLYENN